MISKANAKNQKLMSLIVGSICVFSLIWFGLIRTLQKNLVKTDRLIDEVNIEVIKAQRLGRLLDRFKSDVANANERLQDLEVRMATGDLYRWAIRTFQNFAVADKVDIISLDPPREQSWGIFPSLPYPAAVYSLTGNAYYHDLGKFLSDLQNSFPHLRLAKLELEPAHFGGAGAEEAEKLLFKLEVLILIHQVANPP